MRARTPNALVIRRSDITEDDAQTIAKMVQEADPDAKVTVFSAHSLCRVPAVCVLVPAFSPDSVGARRSSPHTLFVKAISDAGRAGVRLRVRLRVGQPVVDYRLETQHAYAWRLQAVRRLRPPGAAFHEGVASGRLAMPNATTPAAGTHCRLARHTRHGHIAGRPSRRRPRSGLVSPSSTREGPRAVPSVECGSWVVCNPRRSGRPAGRRSPGTSLVAVVVHDDCHGVLGPLLRERVDFDVAVLRECSA